MIIKNIIYSHQILNIGKKCHWRWGDQPSPSSSPPPFDHHIMDSSVSRYNILSYNITYTVISYRNLLPTRASAPPRRRRRADAPPPTAIYDGYGGENIYDEYCSYYIFGSAPFSSPWIGSSFYILCNNDTPPRRCDVSPPRTPPTAP